MTRKRKRRSAKGNYELTAENLQEALRVLLELIAERKACDVLKKTADAERLARVHQDLGVDRVLNSVVNDLLVAVRDERTQRVHTVRLAGCMQAIAEAYHQSPDVDDALASAVYKILRENLILSPRDMSGAKEKQQLNLEDVRQLLLQVAAHRDVARDFQAAFVEVLANTLVRLYRDTQVRALRNVALERPPEKPEWIRNLSVTELNYYCDDMTLPSTELVAVAMQAIAPWVDASVHAAEASRWSDAVSKASGLSTS